MPASEHQYLPNGIAHGAQKQLLVLDTHLRVKTANESFYTAFDTTRDEVIGKKIGAVGNGHWNIPQLAAKLNELLEVEGEVADFEVEQDFPGLGRRTFLVEGWRLPPLDGTPSGLILVSIEDTTAQKGMEEENGESLARFRTTLASIADAVVATNVESRITFMNPAAERLSGWRKKHALHRHLPDIFQLVNEQSVTIDNPVERAIRAGEPVGSSAHAILIARDGSQWPVDDCAAPILDAAGRITGVVLVFREIGQRRRAEKELESSALRYRRLFETAREGILILDAASGQIVDVNPFLLGILGRPREYLLGKELWEIGLFADVESNQAALRNLVRARRDAL